MRLTKYFIPLIKETPSEASITSHKLMLKAGLIRQQNSGIYYWLPLGLKVLKKIEEIVRIELIKRDCIELLAPFIQPLKIWQESGRIDAYGQEMLQFQDRHNNKILFAPTAEEAITDLLRSNIKSYKQMPINVFQMQWKFRDEIRPRFGVMRSREFLMKDGYSFDLNEESAKNTYNKMFDLYLNIFKKMGLDAIPVLADTGVIGGDLSHEFHVISPVGEDEILIKKEYIEQSTDNIDLKKIAISKEKFELIKSDVKENDYMSYRSIEVGHLFYFADKYTKAMKMEVQASDGKKINPMAGSYGIGVSRIIGALIENNHDDKGIVWPSEVAPFQVSLINLRVKDDECVKSCEYLYDELLSSGIDVLYDDTNNSPGGKFATHDLLGMPKQIIVSPRVLSEGKVEIKDRKTGLSEKIEINQVKKYLNQ